MGKHKAMGKLRHSKHCDDAASCPQSIVHCSLQPPASWLLLPPCFSFSSKSLKAVILQQKYVVKTKTCNHSTRLSPTLEPTLPDLPLHRAQEMLDTKDALAKLIT